MVPGIGIGLLDLAALQGDSVDFVAALHRYNLTLLPATAVLPTIRNTYTGAVIKATGIAHEIDCTGATPAANKVVEIGEKIADSTSIGLNNSMSWATHDLSCFWDAVNDSSAPTASFFGIQLGSIGANPPFPSAPSNACLQARININAGNWQLYSAVGDGVTPATIVNSNRGSIDYESKIRLVWKPGVYARLYFWYDVIAEITDPTKLPNFTTPPLARSGLVLCSGSAAWAPRFICSPPMLILDTG